MNVTYESIDEALECGYPSLVPILISTYGDETCIEAYDSLKSETEQIIDRFGDRLFSKEAIDYIDSLFEPYVNSLGYYREISGKYRWYLLYEADGLDSVPLNFGTGACRLTCDHFVYENCTHFDLNELLDKGLLTYVCLCESRIVALATINETFDVDAPAELTVECAVQYRNKGYGCAVLCALTRDLLSKNKKTVYVTSRYNRASVALAKKCGFVLKGKIYAYTAFKD